MHFVRFKEFNEKIIKVQVQGDLSEVFISEVGVRQEDGLTCLLFNIGLEKVVRDSGIQTAATILTRTVQILGYVDDLDLIGRSRQAVEEAFLALEQVARQMGLAVNPSKTKCMVTGPPLKF